MAGTSELKCLLEAEAFNEKMELYLRPLAKAEIVVKLPKVSCIPVISTSKYEKIMLVHTDNSARTVNL